MFLSIILRRIPLKVTSMLSYCAKLFLWLSLTSSPDYARKHEKKILISWLGIGYLKAAGQILARADKVLDNCSTLNALKKLFQLVPICNR